jgi:hypothetical protein
MDKNLFVLVMFFKKRIAIEYAAPDPNPYKIPSNPTSEILVSLFVSATIPKKPIKTASTFGMVMCSF